MPTSKYFEIPLLLLFFFCGIESSISQLPPSFVEQVYDKMFSTMSNGEVAKPRLVLTDNDKVVATYYPEQRELRVSQRFVDLARRFGVDSSNVIAHVFGHELTHILIQRPASIKMVGTGYASKEVSQNMMKLNKVLLDSVYERQADEYACFFAHVAGYKTTHIAGAALDSIYVAFRLSDKDLSRYPPLNERKQIANYAAMQMKLMNDMFENAIISTLSGKYDMAIGLYETIIQNKYTGKEIYNNLGTAYLLKAISYLDSAEYPYTFPIEIDMSTNLDLTRSGIVDVQRILQKAHDKFNKALIRAPDYLLALVNKAIVEFLLEEYDNFDVSLYKLEKDEAYKNHVNLLKAISFYHKGETKDAKRLLKKTKNYDLAEKNYNDLFELNGKGDKEIKSQRSFLDDLSTPRVQRKFFSDEAKRADTLRGSILGGDYFKRLVVNGEKFRSEWWVFYRVNTQLKYHELKDISKYINEVGEDNNIRPTTGYKGFNREYKLIDDKMLIFENKRLTRILIIE